MFLSDRLVSKLPAAVPERGLRGWLESVMEALPLASLLEAMRAVAIEGGSLADVGDNLVQVAIWIPVTFTLAVLAMRPRRTSLLVPAELVADTR